MTQVGELTQVSFSYIFVNIVGHLPPFCQFPPGES